MVRKSFDDLNRAFASILELRKGESAGEVRVYLRGRLIYASREAGRTQVLTLDRDQQRSFFAFMRAQQVGSLA